MGLFKTLLASNDDAASVVPTAAPSSLSIPSVIQMYADDKPLELVGAPSTPSYAHLTYQAVATTAEEPQQQKGLRVTKNAPTVPDLGVWNCRVDRNKEVSGAILAIPSKQLRTFCWKVDLSVPEMVEPTLSALQESLVRYLIATEDQPVETPSTATTSLYHLRSVQFGLAAEDKNESSQAPSPDDRQCKITLQIAALWPATASSTTELQEDVFRQQQTTSLLYYHLRRYAAALNASLVFVASEPNNLLQPVVTVQQLGTLWRSLAQGFEVWNCWKDVLEWKSNETQEDGKEEETTAVAVYGPGSHAEEWIESVLLRNAQYPGHWDAVKDSLWKIFPAPSFQDAALTSNGNATARKSDSDGDQDWLQELRNSIAVTPEVTATPSRPTTATVPESKTPDVSDYFASLLKGP